MAQTAAADSQASKLRPRWRSCLHPHCSAAIQSWQSSCTQPSMLASALKTSQLAARRRSRGSAASQLASTPMPGRQQSSQGQDSSRGVPFAAAGSSVPATLWQASTQTRLQSGTSQSMHVLSTASCCMPSLLSLQAAEVRASIVNQAVMHVPVTAVDMAFLLP